MQGWIIIALISFIYLIGVLILGIRAKTTDTTSTIEGYIAGSRSLGLLIMFFIMGAEIFSAFAFLGGPGWAYSKGAPGLYILVYGSLGLLPWYIIGPKTAVLGKKYGYVTQADLVSDRYKSRFLQVLMAVVSVGAFIPYLTIQIKGAGYIFEASTQGHIPFWFGGLIAYVVVAIYVYTSGLRGIGWTNVVQGIIMVVIAWFIGLYLPYKFFGGIGNMFATIAEKHPEFLTLPGNNATMPIPAFASAILVSVIGFAMWPHLFMKAYGAKNVKTIKQTIVLYPLFALLNVPILIVGFTGILVVPGLKQADTVLIEMVNKGGFSPIMVGVLLAGALAASMSTGSNLAHTAGSIIARDIYQAFNKEASEQTIVNITRVFVLIISAVSYVLALKSPASLVSLLLGAYGAVVQFFPLVAAMFYWKRATTQGAIAGLLTGSLITIYYTFMAKPPFGIHAGIYGLIANTIVLIIVSLVTKPMDEEHVEKFVNIVYED